MNLSRETLEYSRAALLAHTDAPKPSFDTGKYDTHARIAISPQEYRGYAFFGDREDRRSEEVQAQGRINWDNSDGIITAWFSLPNSQFRGLFLAGDTNKFTFDSKTPSDAFNGFCVRSTDRSTSLGIGNLSVCSVGEIQLEEVELTIPALCLDRLTADHLDLILAKRLKTILE